MWRDPNRPLSTPLWGGLMGTSETIRVWSVCRWPSAGGCIPHRRTSTPGRTVDDTVVCRSDTRHQRGAAGRWRIGEAWTAVLVAAEDSVCVLLLCAHYA